MTNVIIVHGAYGYPEENWFPWLKASLEKSGCRVFVPAFPTPENQTLENWLKVFEDCLPFLDEEAIVVGHNLGVPFLLNVIEKNDRIIKAAFFVAGFSSLPHNQFDEILKTFVEKDFNWPKIKQNCQKFYVFHSDNDPYVRLERAQELAGNLGVDLTIVKGAGHFNEKAGYTEFGLLFEEIKSVSSIVD
ncbi:MAG: alpha/beta hydrolase [Patescibacteria group bacterium]|nr:alpha/beta hydrolase [Patescibacteria group bacterium]